jgi:hypothetical protein
MICLKSLLVLCALLGSQAFAKDLNLKCVATYNADKVLEKELTLATGARSLSFGEAEGFEFFLTHSGESTVELQALNIDEPSRTYATAKLTDATSFVELSIWKREFIMEVRCSVI